ncbi:MAG: hypothetical protein HFH13_02450 [Dorea sp.]|nr:hypothetical protein [Dorea sp.]
MLGKEDLKAIEQLMRNVVEENNEVLRTEMFSMKSELRTELKEDITSLRAELKEDIADVRAELKEDIVGVRAELKEDITSVRTELAELKKDIENIIDERIEKSETFLLDEMDRYYQMTQKDILRLEGKVDRIDQYYSVRRLEDENRDLKLQIHDEAIEDIRERLAM